MNDWKALVLIDWKALVLLLLVHVGFVLDPVPVHEYMPWCRVAVED